ncbi:trimeric intracellular cation channel family protein [Rufibacter glacialis]|uniref:Trimeric intracellular cation channel family protein n=1 Tax=Rufibacter glacialis TaxID=1259555 RepID=A0A5M8QI78_9BACT|nr:trimeric intracellular cation channel family protein [Rufibacter glacialis]KAA6434523.1 trimeric intracellular cation channel family protein [Rufibacter glacialis]GGK70336.1 membrane protein [Rufibacter glacialis]
MTELSPLTFFPAIDVVGTFVFAISGTLTAADKKLDPFGASVIAFATALGGGTVRDLLLNLRPIWVQDERYLIAVFVAVVVAVVFRRQIGRLRRTMFLFDTVGIAIFTVLGMEKALRLGVPPLIALVMGVVSAVFGGVVRDILCNEIPLIFRREVYATACLAGGAAYLVMGLSPVGLGLRVWVAIGIIILIRVLAVKYRWAFPNLRPEQ